MKEAPLLPHYAFSQNGETHTNELPGFTGDTLGGESVPDIGDGGQQLTLGGLALAVPHERNTDRGSSSKTGGPWGGSRGKKAEDMTLEEIDAEIAENKTRRGR